MGVDVGEGGPIYFSNFCVGGGVGSNQVRGHTNFVWVDNTANLWTWFTETISHDSEPILQNALNNRDTGPKIVWLLTYVHHGHLKQIEGSIGVD